MKRSLFCLTLPLLSFAHAAFAQDKPSYQEHSHEPKKTVAKPAGMPKVAEKDLADVILAQTLENLWDGADEHFHKGEWNHVVNLNRVIVQGEPWRDEAYTNCAWLLWSSDKNDQALEFLKQGIAANPKSYLLLDEMGYHLGVNLKRPAEAISYYEQAMKLKPRFYTAHNLARCYEKTGQWDKALKIWEIAVDMRVAPSIPNNPIAEQGIRRVKAKLAQKP